jgi:hypothetical protein
MKKQKKLLVALAAVAMLLALTLPAIAGPVGTAAGFEDDDGNLAPQAPIFPLTSLGQVARNATRRGRLEVVAIAGEAARTLDPGQNGNLRSLGKRPHLLEPLPPSKLRTGQWADRPMPVQWANLCPCFLPVNSVDGCERLIPACRQEIGYFSLHLAQLPVCPPN